MQRISQFRPEDLVNRTSFNSQEEKHYHKVYFPVSADCRVNMTENGKLDKYLDFAREMTKAVEHESGNIICNWGPRISLLEQRLVELKIRRILNPSNHNTTNVGYDT